MITILIFFILGYIYTKITKQAPQGLYCGLAGFSGSKPIDPVKMNILLYANQARGTHSTGMYANKTLVRGVMNASQFIEDPLYKEHILDANVVIGHTRFATMGGKTVENAHPFRIGKGRWEIAGTHNGWLFDTLLPELADRFDIEIPDVDSKMIFDILHKTNNFLDIQHIEGAMALAFVRDSKLYLYRRQSKPLYYGFTDEGIYYSSLEWPLSIIRAKNIGFLKTDTLFEIKDGEIVNTISIPQPVVKSLPLDAAPHAWRTLVPREEARHVPFFLERTTEKEKAASNCGNNSKCGAEKPAGRMSMVVNDQGELEVGKESQKDFLRCIDNKKEVQIGYQENRGTDYDINASNDSLLLVNLINNNTGFPVAHWPLFVLNDHKLSTKTNMKGYAAIQLKGDPVEIKLVTRDPLTDKVYYSSAVRPTKGRVLEVTLNIPFRSEKTEEVSDEGQGDKDDEAKHSKQSTASDSIFDGESASIVNKDGDSKGGDNGERGDSKSSAKFLTITGNKVWEEEGFGSEQEWWAAQEERLERKHNQRYENFNDYEISDDMHNSNGIQDAYKEGNKDYKEVRTVADRYLDVIKARKDCELALDIGSSDAKMREALSHSHGLLERIEDELQELLTELDENFCPF